MPARPSRRTPRRQLRGWWKPGLIDGPVRFQLLFGPFRMPRCKVGGWLKCRLRGRVRVDAISDPAASDHETLSRFNQVVRSRLELSQEGMDMAKKKTNPQAEPQRTKLMMARDEARRRLEEQIDKGEALGKRNHEMPEQLQESLQEYYRWDEYNSELLRQMFNTDQESRNYSGFSMGSAIEGGHQHFAKDMEHFRRDVEYHLNRLRGLRDRLDLFEEPAATHALAGPSAPSPAPRRTTNEVFLVHGHDDLAKQTVARFVERLGLKVVILHEQPNQGRTIIEKFECFSQVAFAIVLLTPDDVGASKAAYSQAADDAARSRALNDRARQNVVFELGFFVGLLQRGHVCALVKGNVEIPSDLHGLVYTPLDDKGAWRLELAKEMKAAGLDVDLNKAV